MFDLASIEARDQFVLHLERPDTGEKIFADAKQTKPVTITVYGPGSEQHKRAISALQNRTLKRQAKGNKNVTAEVIREDQLELMVALSADSENLSFNGNPIKTADDFRNLYSNEKYKWVRDQVDAAVSDFANFLTQ